MSTLLSITNGDFTAAGTWGLVDPSSYVNSEAASTSTTTSYVGSPNFTPGAITADAIGLKVLSRAAGPTGTFSIELYNATLAASVAGTEVTCNVSDLPSNGGATGGWYQFEFAAPVLLLAATNYQVRVKSSAAAQVAVYRTATAADWSKAVRTTTTQAPAASDDLLVCGKIIGAGATTSFTVTMDNTSSATAYGPLEISAYSTFTWGTTAATNYYLKLDSNLKIWQGGTYNMGTSGTPMPASSTASLEMVSTVNVEFGVEILAGSTVNAYGNPITVKAFLAADAAAAATSLTTDVSTGWLSGDSIALASTTRTAAEAEMKALTANAVGTALTISAITNAHSGTSPTQGELANLTRNVKIFGTSTTLQSYINIATTSVSFFDSVEFYNLGSGTVNKRGINLQTTTGSCTINKCSLHDFIVTSSTGILTSGTANNFTISNNVFYNIQNSALSISSTTGTSWSTTDNLAIKNVSGNLIVWSDLGGTITNNTATSGISTGVTLGDTDFTGTVSGFVSHSNGLHGIVLQNITANASGKVIQSSTVWRNNSSGVLLSNAFGFTIDTATIFGNLVASINYSTHSGNITFKSITASAGSTLTCPVGVNFGVGCADQIFDSCSFGAVTNHTTADVTIPSANTYLSNVIFKNCLFSSVNEIINTSTNTNNGSYIGSQKHDQTVNNHKSFRRSGVTTIDTTIFNTASPSTRLAPSSATLKLEDSLKRFAVNSGATVTVNVYVRKSSVGDGTAYNGNEPRLILKASPAAGIASDVVLDTMSVATGTWELLSGVTSAPTDNAVLECVVDCDGTLGWVNIDDWRIS